MKEIDERDLDTALALGDAICDELGICCDKRGRAIFKVYKKLQELKSQKLATDKPEQEVKQPE
jgi:hypothetical protein